MQLTDDIAEINANLIRDTGINIRPQNSVFLIGFEMCKGKMPTRNVQKVLESNTLHTYVVRRADKLCNIIYS